MLPKFLLPHWAKRFGYVISIPTFIVIFLNLHFGFMFRFLEYRKNITHDEFFPDNNFLFNLKYNNFTDEIAGVLLVIGLLMIAFSKEKQEDERVLSLRLESLLWAVFINSVILILSIIFFYDGAFLNIMAYNVCSTLIIFIVRFNILMYADQKKIKN